MERFKETFLKSTGELKSHRTVVTTAMMIALGVLLGAFSIQVTPFIKIGFSGIANDLTALLFGPVVGGIMGGMADLIKHFTHPTGPYFVGWTINAILGSMIYGCFFYRKPITFKRILGAKICVALTVNLLLGTYWLHIMYGKAFFALLPIRFLKQVIMVPIDSTIFFVLVKSLQKAKVFQWIYSAPVEP